MELFLALLLSFFGADTKLEDISQDEINKYQTVSHIDPWDTNLID
tara:strand:+ start:367 stop:501 length:135 start_codon:yes stop_codon:yes gene_type:complete